LTHIPHGALVETVSYEQLNHDIQRNAAVYRQLQAVYLLLGAMDPLHSVSIDAGIDADGAACFFIKLQGPHSELNVAVPASELDKLRDVLNAHWLNRGSLRVGKCLGTPAFWSYQDERLSVLIGADDETWEVGYFAPESAVSELVGEIERVRNE
jgi:hypothetical protein